MSASFLDLLRQQIRNEFTASQQYVAVAVWFDDFDMPRMAAHFYAQSVEERNHAMMMVQYLLDCDEKVQVPGVDDVRTDFRDAVEPIQARARAGEGRDRPDRAAGQDGSRPGRLPRRAVHAVVPEGAGRGGRLHDHAAHDRPARRRQHVPPRGLRGARDGRRGRRRHRPGGRGRRALSRLLDAEETTRRLRDLAGWSLDGAALVARYEPARLDGGDAVRAGAWASRPSRWTTIPTSTCAGARCWCAARRTRPAA
nr:ferritin-like domain-containing protein [Angustibacter aerolatus]